MTAILEPVLEEIDGDDDWIISHYVVCQDPDCFDCPGDSISLCGEIVDEDWIEADCTFDVVCVVCEELFRGIAS